MEDLIGIIIFIIFIGSRFLGAASKMQKKEPQRPRKPFQPNIPGWPGDVLTGPSRPAPSARPIPRPAATDVPPAPTPTFPVHPPVPERTGPTSTTLREPSVQAGIIFGQNSLKQAIIMKEVLGPPKAKQKMDGYRKY